MKRAAAALAAALALTACGSDPEVGRVVEKRYEPAYTAYVQMCMSYNPKGFCQVWMPMPYTSGPFYVLELTDGNERWAVTTTSARYERINVGDTVNTYGGEQS